MLVRDGGSGDDPGDQPQIREELLDEVEPSADCPDAPEGPAAGDGEVVVHVVRVVDSCLAFSGEAVAEDEVDDRLRDLRADPDVVAADRAVTRSPAAPAASGAPGARAHRRAPSQPDSQQGDEPAEQWALGPDHLDGAQVRELWPDGADDVRVAVIDTGIDDTHLDLADQVVARVPWMHRYEGKYDRHGTHVGGIIAANDDGAGAVGLTPAARLIDVQYHDGDEEHLAGPTDDLGEYVRWAVDHGAEVINMSLSGREGSDTELTAVLYAERQGVVVVSIPGNCGDEDPDPCEARHEIRYPAAYDTVLGVGNHTEDGERSTTSSANRTVDVAAPGTDIVSVCLTDIDGGGDRRPTCEASGTSMAAPYVSATAALLRARHPDATPAAVREAIIRSARPPAGTGEGERTRTDDLGWGLLDPAAAAQYLDEHPGGGQDDASPSHERTRIAYLDTGDDRLMVLDDGIPHPVRNVPDESVVDSVDWSGDGNQLVGTVDDTLFSWTGPGSTPSEVACAGCDVAYLDRLGSDLVIGAGSDGTVTRFDPDTLEALGSVQMALPAPDQSFVLRGDTGRALLVGHAPDSAAGSPNTLWLVDPVTGEPVASHAEPGNTRVSEVAVDATGDRVAYAGAQPGEVCDGPGRVYVLDTSDGGLDEVSAAGVPTSDLGILEAEDIFFNGDAVYATFDVHGPEDGLDCTQVGSAGLWRLDDGGETWEQVDDAPLLAVRPIEGLTGDPATGKVIVGYDDRIGRFVPTGADGAEQAALGDLYSVVWATPTTEEVDLAREGSPPPVDGSDGSDGSDEGEGDEGGGPVPNTTEAAVARFEDYLHALGDNDIDTVCEIAGPAAQIAEQEGAGPCPTAFGTVFEMISEEQEAALRTATVDVDRVTALGGQVQIPVEAVVADVTFTESNLGSYTLAYQDGNWFIVE